MFEEVKEMIDSTIYTNGRGEVTAQNINLAMHGVVEATEEELGKVNDAVKTVEDKVTVLEENGIGGGTGALRVWLYGVDINELTQEQVNENIATYNSLLKDVAQPVVICIYYSSSNTTIGESIVCDVTVQVHEYNGEKIELVSFSTSYFEVLLNPDGTIEIVLIDEPSTPAPSGPLRVWLYQNDMSELTQQQVDDNIATYNAIASGDTTSVLVCIKFEDDSLLSVSTYHATCDYVAYSNGQKFVTLTIYGVDADLLVTAASIELNADGTITME